MARLIRKRRRAVKRKEKVGLLCYKNCTIGSYVFANNEVLVQICEKTRTKNAAGHPAISARYIVISSKDQFYYPTRGTVLIKEHEPNTGLQVTTYGRAQAFLKKHGPYKRQE